jgi:hypothetical protein
MIYLLTAIGLLPGGSSTVHVYTQTIRRMTQNKKYVEQHKNFGEQLKNKQRKLVLQCISNNLQEKEI